MNTKSIWLMVGILVAVTAAGVFLFKKPKVSPTTSQMPVPGAENVEETVVVGEDSESVREIEISGDEYSFTPSSVSVVKGEKVKIVFTNKGNIPHNLVITELGVSTKTIGSGQTDSLEFTVEGDTVLKFYCNIGNHRNLGMEGKIEVK